MASATKRYDTAEGLFTSALKDFKDSLPTDGANTLLDFKSAEEMVRAVEEQVNRAPEKRRLLSCCKKVERFARKWEPFFEIINIFLNSHPEWSALAWGAVRLVFKLSSHYATFFEKLADMFERIGQILPHYQRQVEFFKTRGHTASTRALLDALAHVYIDIINFCHEACRIFSTKKRGVRYKLSVIKDLFWTPFDVRFSNLLGRLSKHQELYELELSLADRQELLEHYEKFDKELRQAEHYRQTQSSNARIEAEKSLRLRIREIKDWIRAPDYMTTFERERANISASAGHWLLRHPTYILWRDSPTKPSDAREQPNCVAGFASRVLTIYGSPGYGKTVLSTLVIEDAACDHAPTTQASDCLHPCVAFFHFDKMNPSCTAPHQAIRAILTQIVHRNQSNKDLVDAASILMDTDGTGQLVGSEAEIASVLSLALQRSHNLTLVFDGVDECVEPVMFLQKLYAISEKSSCRIVLFSRPNLQLTQPFQRGRHHIHLSSTANLRDIQQFLRPKINDLFWSNLLPPVFSAEEVVLKISRRANSLFLWARLMVSYLQCPALSPRERKDAINTLNLLEGLDAMYSKIIEVISKRLQPERRTAFRVFQWLVVTYRPLQLTELRAALAVRLQKPSSVEMDYIVDFAHSLVTICGALVELREDGSVQFIHLSVNEYLTSKETLADVFSPRDLHVDIHSAHLAVAGHSLSYLIYDVPGSPLSGSSKVVADKTRLRVQYPLLEYSLYWWRHATHGLVIPEDIISRSFEIAGSSFVLLTTEFLGNRPAVTAWIEACWTFSRPPEIRQLAEQIVSQQRRCSTASNVVKGLLARVGGLTKTLARLSDDVEYLDKEWNHVLTDQPNQIWEPSINMFRESHFLIGTNAAKILWIASEQPTQAPIPLENEDLLGHTTETQEMPPITLASQVSADGHRLASIILVRPKSFAEIADTLFIASNEDNCSNEVGSVGSMDFKQSARVFVDEEDLDQDEVAVLDREDVKEEDNDITRSEMRGKIVILDMHSSGWKARYRSWALDDMQSPVIDHEIDLPERQIFNMLLTSFHEMEPGELRIPVSFSPDLQTFTILQSVVRVSTACCRMQTLDDVALCTFHGLVRSNPQLLQTSLVDMTGLLWYHASFSSNGKVLAAVRSGAVPGNEKESFEYHDCWLAIYEESSMGSDVPSYQLSAMQGPFEELGGVSKLLAFHPNNGILATVLDGKTYLWKFTGTTPPSISLTIDYQSAMSQMVEIYGHPLEDITFSPCGRYFGGSRVSGEAIPIILPVDKIISTHDRPMAEQLHVMLLRQTSPGREITAVQSGMSFPEYPPTQSSNDIVITTSENGGIQKSTLKQYNADNAVLLSSFSQDGTQRVAELVHLPISGGIGTSFPTLLNPFDDNNKDMIRMVLNKAVQDKYNLEDCPGLVLPLVLERRKDTISTFTKKRCLDWEDDTEAWAKSSRRTLALTALRSRVLAPKQEHECYGPRLPRLPRLVTVYDWCVEAE